MISISSVIFISIHAPHARSDIRLCGRSSTGAIISIHAPHARSDLSCLVPHDARDISIHAPHARSDCLI